jgi:predicted nucleic acid-binding protein
MNAEDNPLVLYWDASAVLSALFKDDHSRAAHERANRPGYHLLSSLAYAEVQAVIRRIKRERLLADVLVKAAEESLDNGPWRPWQGAPQKEAMKTLAGRYSLRGADLWHLAAAQTLKEDLPEIKLLTYDRRLWTGAQGEGLELDPRP